MLKIRRSATVLPLTLASPYLEKMVFILRRGPGLLFFFSPDPAGGHQIRHGEHHITISPSSDYQNCTVAYMSQCTSLNKCRMSCQSMGAARYRWFHEHGCCECIGSTCLDFGKVRRIDITRPQNTVCLTGLDIKHLVHMPVGHVVLKIYVPFKNLHMPSQYLYKPCTVYVYCWKNKYMPTVKNHLPSQARNHKSLCALGQDLHAPGMRARLIVKPCLIYY